MNFYTYAYLREDGTPYYVGKGKGRRAFQKHPGHTVPPRDRIIFLKKNLTEEAAFTHEQYMIAVLGRKDINTGILRNRSDGGAGGTSGAIMSDEWRRKNRKPGKLNGFYGRTHTAETKALMTESLKGRKAWNEGKVFSDNPHAAYMRAYRAAKKAAQGVG